MSDDELRVMLPLEVRCLCWKGDGFAGVALAFKLVQMPDAFSSAKTSLYGVFKFEFSKRRHQARQDQTSCW